MDLLVFGSKSDVSLQIEEGLVGVAFDLQALGSFEVGFGIFLVQVDSNSEILGGLSEVAKDGEDESPKIEIFRDIILTLFDGFIDICNSFIEIIAIKMQYGSIVIESRDVIVAELWKMCNSNTDIFYCFFQKLIFGYWIVLFLKFIFNNIEGLIEIGFWFVGNEMDCFLDDGLDIFGEEFEDLHYQLVIVFGKVLLGLIEFFAKLFVFLVFFLGVRMVGLAELAVTFVEMYQRFQETVTLLLLF